ncbi:MAG: hypothetical protein M3Q07_07055, partial [Pseudobdellovibrionaceae bacterium]|nr:hypothetical protein [Pseudobdellovibrionaceae bacterium]
VMANVWTGCAETLSRKALDYAPETDTYFTIACQKIWAKGQPLTWPANPVGTLAGLQSRADGRSLLVWTTEAVYILADDNGSWNVQQTLQPGLKNDPLVLVRWNQKQTQALLASKNGRLFLARLADGQLLEIRLPKGRPFNLDDMRFQESSHRISLLAPEGVVEFPDSVEAITQDLCSPSERIPSCVD